MICSKCGHQLKEQARFCVNCGESIPTDILWKKTLKIAGCVGIAAGCYYLFNATRWGIAFPHSILLVQELFFIFVSVMFVINGAKYEKMKTLMIYSIVLFSLVLITPLPWWWRIPLLWWWKETSLLWWWGSLFERVRSFLPWLFLYASLMTKKKWLKIAGITICVLMLSGYRFIHIFGSFHFIVDELTRYITEVLPIIFLVGTRKIIRYMKNGETQMVQ